MIITDITWAFLYDARFALLGLTAASSTAIGWLRVVTWPSSVARPLATRHTAFWPRWPRWILTMNWTHTQLHWQLAINLSTTVNQACNFCKTFSNYARQGGHVLVSVCPSVRLSVCLSVSSIPQNCGWIFMTFSAGVVLWTRHNQIDFVSCKFWS